ncbi:aldolase [Choiromyces venosus 120613-1]|uniref:Aldolase n=1 Tax=Choiromyces venosus 120613-1 TaxID=1336337 RepID=A0A3N4J2V8_9PEZI|nr:aldolase [Choiromyces venosus 120613-1]
MDNAQTSHALHLARSGITGLVLLGSTGEAVHLTRTERVAQIKHVRAALTAGGYEDCPLIAGAATNGIEETMELLNESAAAGAGWGLVLAPGYFAAATSQEGIIALYKGVVEGSSIPVMMFVSPLLPPQDPALPVKQLPLPRRQQQYKTPPSIFRTLAAHPNIVDGKLSHGDISIHAQIALDPEIDHSKFHLFIGLSQQLFPVLQVGCNGAIESLAAIFTKTVVHVYNLVAHTEAMDQETLGHVRELQYRVSRAEELIVKFGTIEIKEAVA